MDGIGAYRQYAAFLTGSQRDAPAARLRPDDPRLRVRREFAKQEYAERVDRLRQQYPVLALRARDWVRRIGGSRFSTRARLAIFLARSPIRSSFMIVA